jgi:ribosomal-protein-alanine N-acetyltransferase
MKIVLAKPGHEVILANFYAVNERHFRRWSPTVPAGHHSVRSWKRRLEERQIELENRLSAHFIGTDATESYVIGACSLGNIVRGIFQACHIGYSISERYQGSGSMKPIVMHAIDYAFNELKLHRIMANHMPANERSAGLLKSLGFEIEGYAKQYLLIDGKWEDHVLNSLLKNSNS